MEINQVLWFIFFIRIKLKRRLKNRISAQAARERKKARMDELERQLGLLSERFNFIEQENFRLRERLSQYEMVDNFIGTYKDLYTGEIAR